MYSRFTVASVPSTDTRFERDALQAGLIAGTVPTNGTVNRARRCGSTMVDAVLQAITTMSGACAAISSAISGTTRPTSASSLCFAVGKEGVVGDVDIIRVRPRLHDFAEHREAAEAGIEHEDAHGGTGWDQSKARSRLSIADSQRDDDQVKVRRLENRHVICQI